MAPVSVHYARVSRRMGVLQKSIKQQMNFLRNAALAASECVSCV